MNATKHQAGFYIYFHQDADCISAPQGCSRQFRRTGHTVSHESGNKSPQVSDWRRMQTHNSARIAILTPSASRPASAMCLYSALPKRRNR